LKNEIFLRPTHLDELHWILRLEAGARAEGFIRGYDEATHRKRMADPHVRYLTILRQDEEVGFIILAGIGTQDRNIELCRIIIGPRESGIGQSAMKEVLRYLFEEVGANRVSLDTFSYNKRAQHIYQKLGFVKEGVLREALLFDGKYHDLYLYGLLASEWKNRSH